MTSLVATTKGFDAIVVVHAVCAVATIVVLLVLRAAARAVESGSLTDAARRSFTGRPELAGRLVHVVPLTGVAALATSRGAYSFGSGFIVVGILAWAAAAGCLEVVALPAQRQVALAVADGGSPNDAARSAATRMVRAIELAALAIVVAAIAMIAIPTF